MTAAVLSQRAVEEAHARLSEEKLRGDALVKRQMELIQCLGWVSDVARSAETDSQSAELIDSVRRQLATLGESESSPMSSRGGSTIELKVLIGQGSFGKVYRGKWNGREVAIKSMVLPIKLDGAAKRERMALLEAAISTSLFHPNIVQVTRRDTRST